MMRRQYQDRLNHHGNPRSDSLNTELACIKISEPGIRIRVSRFVLDAICDQFDGSSRHLTHHRDLKTFYQISVSVHGAHFHQTGYRALVARRLFNEYRNGGQAIGKD